MPVLHNRISNETLKAQMLAETEPRTTISFYKYFTIVDPQATRDALWVALTQLKVFGRIYLAREGINAQISVPQSNVEALREFLYGFDPALAGLRFNIAVEDDGKSFWVLRLKVAIVSSPTASTIPRLMPQCGGVSQGGGSQRDA